MPLRRLIALIVLAACAGCLDRGRGEGKEGEGNTEGQRGTLHNGIKYYSQVRTIAALTRFAPDVASCQNGGADFTNQQEATDGQYLGRGGEDQAGGFGAAESDCDRGSVPGAEPRLAERSAGPGQHGGAVRPPDRRRERLLRAGAAPGRRGAVHRRGVLPGAVSGSRWGCCRDVVRSRVRRDPARHRRSAGVPLAGAPGPRAGRDQFLHARHAGAARSLPHALEPEARVRLPGGAPAGAVRCVRERACGRRTWSRRCIPGT